MIERFFLNVNHHIDITELGIVLCFNLGEVSA